MSRPRFNPRLQGPRSLVSGFEKRENNKRAQVQDPGFTLKTTVTSAMWFSAHVVLNRMELLCHVMSTFGHMRLVPPQNTTHSVCMRHDLLNSFLFMRHDFLNLSRIFFNLKETCLVHDNMDHCARLW